MDKICAFLLGWAVAFGFWCSYQLGGTDRQNTILFDCRDYGRYVVDETWQINCVGPYNPLLLIPEYKPYDEEVKRKGRPFRK